MSAVSQADNMDLVKRWVTEGLGGNPLIANELIAAEYIAHDAGPDDPPGPHVQREMILSMHRAFTSLKFVIEDIFADDDCVVVRDRMVGVNTGRFFGRPATNRSVDVERITIYRIEDRKLRESWTAMNTFALLQQLGLLRG